MDTEANQQTDNKKEPSKAKEVLVSLKNKTTHFYKLTGLYFQKFFHGHSLLIIGLIATIISLTCRFLVATYPANDLAGIIFNWIEQIKDVGFTKFYTISADYSDAYLFFIALVSLFPEGNLITVGSYTFSATYMYIIKGVYFAVDVLAAFGIYLLVKEISNSKKLGLIGYIIFLALPVQFANSAIWGNCDVIYVCLFIYCIYFILKDKDGLAWCMFGLALAQKPQSVFILPFLVYLLLNRKLKLYKIIYAVIAVFVSFLPAYICGAGFTQPFKYFINEMGMYSNLTLGCGNMWHLMNFSSSAMDIINKASAWIGLLLIGVFLAIVYLRKIDLSKKENIFYVGVFLTAIVPFFLPHMHERYFYVLDTLIVAYCLIKKKHYYLIPLMQVSSGIAYYHYLSGNYFIQALGEGSVHISAFINLFVLIVIFYDLMKLDHSTKTKEEEVQELDAEIKNEKNQYLKGINQNEKN